MRNLSLSMEITLPVPLKESFNRQPFNFKVPLKIFKVKGYIKLG